MLNNVEVGGVLARRVSAGLQRVMRQLPLGGAERQAIASGEIDAVIDYGKSNVILLSAARRVLREAARRAALLERKPELEVPERNRLLAALPPAEYRRLLPALEQVNLDFGDVLQEAGAPIRYVYFPVGCVICLLTPTDDQRAIATGLVGPEGMLGIPLALEVDNSCVRAEVQVAGAAFRMPAARLTSELQRGQQLQRQLFRHAQVKINQARQFAACMASHCLEQRLACWLLTISDRAGSHRLHLTQEYVARVLNVRRVSVTHACGSLRARGLIRYSRGSMVILDRPGLESASCQCYRVLAVTGAWPAAAQEAQTTRCVPPR